MFVSCWEENGRRSSVVCRATFGNLCSTSSRAFGNWGGATKASFGRSSRQKTHQGPEPARGLPELLLPPEHLHLPGLDLVAEPPELLRSALRADPERLRAPARGVEHRLLARGAADGGAPGRRRAPGSAITAHAPSADAGVQVRGGDLGDARDREENTASSAEAIREAARSTCARTLARREESASIATAARLAERRRGAVDGAVDRTARAPSGTDAEARERVADAVHRRRSPRGGQGEGRARARAARARGCGPGGGRDRSDAGALCSTGVVERYVLGNS